MTAPVLLVHDDIAAIASVRRLLTRVGHEVVLATSVGDAVVAFGHHRPPLVILAPDVEGGRGEQLLAELEHHPNRAELRLVLLGRELPGVDAALVRLPLDGKQLLDVVDGMVRDESASPAAAPDSDGEPTAKPETVASLDDDGERLRRTADALFEETHREIEAEAVASVSAALDIAWSDGSDWATPPSRDAIEAEVADFERGVLEAADQRRGQLELVENADATEPAPPPTTREAPKPPRIKSRVAGDRGGGLAPSGTVSLEDLARLVLRLSEERGTVRLDLRADGAVRSLWFEAGLLLAADSNRPGESLLDRARRDGLIDSRQHAGIRLARGASSARLLELLKDRGYVREQEVVPLVQRHTENVALEALAEPTSEYRVTAEAPGPDVAAAAGARRPAEIVLEALRKSVDAAERLAGFGGLAAIPSLAAGAEERVSALGLGEREERFVSLLDDETPIEEILLASGLRQDSALKLLGALFALGWVDLRAPDIEPQPPPPPTLELERLDAKFREVQEADYFAILGISRAAGGDEVQRAFERLSAEFDALKYAGHPDPNVHHRAREIQAALTEAAQVLRDDRLRSSYSRHLVD